MNPCLSICIKVSKAIPLLFIALVIGWSYYAYIIALCIFSIPAANIAEKVILIILYHLVLAIFLWAYAQTVFTSPIRPPDQFNLSPTEWDRVQAASAEQERNHQLQLIVASRQLPVQCRGAAAAVRVCHACKLIKPDRAHHCSTCDQCLLKMDHHCPWVNNCVGLHNYKFFIQFLLYGCVYCLYVAASAAKYFVTFWTEGVNNLEAFRFHVLFMVFVAVMFSLSLMSLGVYHLHLTSRNLTTLESFRAPLLPSGPDKRAYHVGCGNNFKQVFGDSVLYWFLPLQSCKVDGVSWPLRSELDSEMNGAYSV